MSHIESILPGQAGLVSYNSPKPNRVSETGIEPKLKHRPSARLLEPALSMILLAAGLSKVAEPAQAANHRPVANDNLPAKTITADNQDNFHPIQDRITLMVANSLQPDNPQSPIFTDNQGGEYYTVQLGDNLTEIGREKGVSVAEILYLNPTIKDANLIYPGQVLTLKSPQPAQPNQEIQPAPTRPPKPTETRPSEPVEPTKKPESHQEVQPPAEKKSLQHPTIFDRRGSILKGHIMTPINNNPINRWLGIGIGVGIIFTMFKKHPELSIAGISFTVASFLWLNLEVSFIMGIITLGVIEYLARPRE